jgi:hypothetical protein
MGIGLVDPIRPAPSAKLHAGQYARVFKVNWS